MFRLITPATIVLLGLLVLTYHFITQSNGRLKTRVQRRSGKGGDRRETIIATTAIPYNFSQHRFAFSRVRRMLFFIGYPRSCSTLLSSFLDAHPNVVIANEYNFFNVWPAMPETREKYERDFLYSELLRNSILSVSTKGIRRIRDNVGEGELAYRVPNEWNGKYNKTIEIIGDKHASATRALTQQNARIWGVKTLQQIVQVPIQFLHIIRNPYDNIATLAIRAVTNRKFILEKKILDDEESIYYKINEYFSLASKVNFLRKKYDVIDIHSIDLLRHPKETMRKLCATLEIECSEKYVNDCASLLFKTPSQSRKNVKWTLALKERVEKLKKHFDFLHQYSFTSD